MPAHLAYGIRRSRSTLVAVALLALVATVASAQPEEPAAPGWFDASRIPALIASLAFAGLVIGYVAAAQRGKDMFIRRIAGLEAVEEAVGRATEMGRPILFSPGLERMDQIATVAAMNVLGEVAKRVAHYGIPILVPNYDPIVMTVAQEVVRDSYMSAGVPERYREQDIFYTTESQFGYAAAVVGTMMRDKPATNFFFGRFYAESLVLAETGNLIGAVQIAGTDADAQLPFFITSCDYTLIGEELYAGSVYLSREPLLMGALKAQDAGKAIVLALILIGSVLALLGVALPKLAS